MFDGSHPCEYVGCSATVAYDDEPYCYKHSPESGSFVPGYSYKAGVEALRLAQKIDDAAFDRKDI